VEHGVYEPNWRSLSHHKLPDWFLDGKFGIWSHWGPQAVPGVGDWYGVRLYEEGSSAHDYHLKTYGHPSKVGYKDVIPLWKAERFDPDRLARLYADAGARYIVALANHHDNFDTWASTYQPWNSVNMGPHRDIVRAWKDAAARNGLKFGVSIHNINSWGWFDGARGADAKGPLAGVPYDGVMRKADGEGTWWRGYDPADLYGPPHKPGEHGDPPTPAFMANWFLRTKQLIDAYHPDILEFDLASPIHKWRTWVEFEDVAGTPKADSHVGMLIAQHFFNSERKWNGGKDGGVLTLKWLPEERRTGATMVYEQTYAPASMPEPWQKELSMGDWFYDRGASYLGAEYLVRVLVEVVSHNGNLLLNVVQRPDGTIDGDQEKTLQSIGGWLKANGSAIYATRPWKIAAEGPNRAPSQNDYREQTKETRLPTYSPADLRFTQSKDGKTLHVIAMAIAPDRKIVIASLAQGSALWPAAVSAVFLSDGTKLPFLRDDKGLHVDLSAGSATGYPVALAIN
jgi:alpha-L-fucosidase